MTLDVLIEKWEDEQDFADADAALREGGQRRSWESIKGEFGL